MIAHHACSKLSRLDIAIAEAVRPGGNWRNIPANIPSERIAQIRISALAGEGSRSTYYGRLRPDCPAYTINTYYVRPGNGCFLHYDFEGGQHRTLSHREAARLQTFPDYFKFEGTSQRAICQQIGNAVPPLLSFQVARALGEPGAMVDVFAGAGGLSLGFEWAGWRSLSAVDLDRHAVATFNSNVSPVAFVGDMNDDKTHDRLAAEVKSKAHGSRLALVGGPPCQGFSTGGNRRSADDQRNSLYTRYTLLLGQLRPDVFVFENVLGLLNIEQGKFIERVLFGLREVGYNVAIWRLNSANFGVPQRRERVIIVGTPKGGELPNQPQRWTSPRSNDLFAQELVCCTADALDDLPPLMAGQDGSRLNYISLPRTQFQRLVRGEMAPLDYVAPGIGRNNSDRQPTIIRRLA